LGVWSSRRRDLATVTGFAFVLSAEEVIIGFATSILTTFTRIKTMVFNRQTVPGTDRSQLMKGQFGIWSLQPQTKLILNSLITQETPDTSEELKVW
jgi:hypothetical protein